MVGLPKNIIKKYGISKKAWDVFRGRGRGSRRRRGGTVTVARRGRRYSPRRWIRHFRKPKPKTIPMAPIAGVVGGLLLTPAPGRDSAINAVTKYGDFVGAGKIVLANLTGYDVDRGFNFQTLIRGWTPIIAGVGVHYLANALGINRMMARLPSPLNKVRI